MTERCHRRAGRSHAAASILTRTASRPQPHNFALLVHRQSCGEFQSCRSTGSSRSHLHVSTPQPPVGFKTARLQSRRHQIEPLSPARSHDCAHALFCVTMAFSRTNLRGSTAAYRLYRRWIDDNIQNDKRCNDPHARMRETRWSVVCHSLGGTDSGGNRDSPGADLSPSQADCRLDAGCRDCVGGPPGCLGCRARPP